MDEHQAAYLAGLQAGLGLATPAIERVLNEGRREELDDDGERRPWESWLVYPQTERMLEAVLALLSDGDIKE